MPQPLGHRRALAAVSAAQLATELAGMVVGLRRRHPYDVFWMHGDPATITRDAVFRGTALSAPVPNMLIQAAMTAVVVRWPSRRAAHALGGWGALMVAGYLGERLVRQRLRPSGWDALESPWPWPWPRSAGEASARRGRVAPGEPPARLACASRRYLGATKIGACTSAVRFEA